MYTSCTFITEIYIISCPSSITPSVTVTSHVVTYCAVSTMSCTLLTTVDTIPSFIAFCYTEKCTLVLKFIEKIIPEKKKINEGIELGVGKILHLTCFTINPGPSRFTYKTHSTLYVTRAVVAIIRTRCITVTTVKTSIFASCFKHELYMCNTRLKKWKLIKRYS